MFQSSVVKIGAKEFVFLIAALMALTALAIDIMLPALSDIRNDFHVPNPNAGQLLVVVFLMAFGISQPLFGPLTDHYGRRRPLFAGLILYALAGFHCMAASSFESLLAGRIVQGVASGLVRVIAVSIVRDVSAGRNMARTMSTVMMVFMLVPIIAPALGQAIITIKGDWKPIFLGLSLYAFALLIWSGRRLAETLPPAKRIQLDAPTILASYAKAMSTRQTLCYGLANGMMFGTLFSFVAVSQQIFDEIYGLAPGFPLYFGGCGLTMVIAHIFNASYVLRLGMRTLSHAAVVTLLMATLTHLGIAMLAGGSAPFLLFYPLLLATFFCVALTGPNFNALAMEQLGDIAGTAAALLGFISTFIASSLGWAIGQTYAGRTDTLLTCHVLLALLSLFLILIAEKGKLFGTRTKSRNQES